MLKRFKIDPIISFLSLSIIFIIFCFPSAVNSIFNPTILKLVDGDVKNEVSIPSPNANIGERIKVRSEDNSLLYSFDGGDNYYDSDENGIKIGEIDNHDILNRATSIRWKHPIGPFPVVKTISISLKTKKTISEATHLTYVQEYHSKLPIVSLIIKESDLFDWEDGIMILGERSSNQRSFKQNWWDRNANYKERSYTARKRVSFQYFENGELIVDQSSFMKIAGNASRAFPQKSLKIYPIDKYGRAETIDFPFFGKPGNRKYESLVLRQSGNDNTETMFADLLMHELAAESKAVILNGYPVSVFINGNYWGIYNLRERIDDYMLSKREDSKSSDITILNCETNANFSNLVDGDSKEKIKFEDLIKLTKSNQLSKAGYDSISNEISLKSFIDYIFFETYYGNQDWLHNNTTWFKAKGGQWKWILNDLDFSLAYPGKENINSNLFNKLLSKNSIMGSLFTSLLTVDEFKTKFLDRSEKHLDEIFTKENLTKKFNSLKAKYEADIQYEIDRWRSISSYSEWEKSCAENLNFLINRKEIYIKQLEEL